MPDERERLVTHLSELIRLADLSIYDQTILINRVKKTSIEVLREIAEETNFLAWMLKRDPQRTALRRANEERMRKVIEFGAPA
jgi:hypothetical protein